MLHAALEVVPEGASLDIFDLEGIPVFNEDLIERTRMRHRLSNRHPRRGRHPHCNPNTTTRSLAF